MMAVNWAWWRRWTVLLSGLVCLQMAVQACNAVTGFLLVRWLPREEYSLFTLTGSLLSLMVLFTDLGLTVGLVSIGGRVCSDRARHASLVADGLLLRRQLYYLTLLVMAPVGYGLLRRTGAEPLQAGLLMALVLVAGGFAASALVHASVARLHGRHRAVQLAELASSGVRLLASAAGVATAALALVATAAVALSQAVFGARLRRTRADLLGPLPAPTGEHRRELLATLRTLAPTAIFHSVQGQVTTFLLVFMGTSGQVADLGAISRYQIVFGICGVILAQVVTPAAARATDPAHYRHLLRTTLLGYAAYSLAAIAAAWLLWRPALALLGGQYLGLRDELILSMLSAALGGLNGLLWNFVSARNWIRHVWVIIPLTLAAQVLLALWLPLDTVSGALVFGSFSTLPGIVWFLWRGFRSFSRPHAFS